MKDKKMNIAQCNGPCGMFCDFSHMFLHDGHLYCEEDKPEGAESMRDAEVFESIGGRMPTKKATTKTTAKKKAPRNGKPHSKLAEANNLKPKINPDEEVIDAGPATAELETIIVECPACNQKNRVIVERNEPLCGKCGEELTEAISEALTTISVDLLNEE